jgi:hypothetical protein
LEDLIRNVHTLFDDQPSTSLPLPSPAVETTPSGSFSGAELSQRSEVDAMGPTTRRLGLVGVTPSLTQSSLSSSPSDFVLESSLTQSPTAFPGPLPSSSTLVEGVERNSQERVTPEVRGMVAVEPEALVNGPPPEVVSLPPTSVTEWQLRKSQLPPSQKW